MSNTIHAAVHMVSLIGPEYIHSSADFISFHPRMPRRSKHVIWQVKASRNLKPGWSP
jgi:pentose-5-phosphate-3-epimerase